MMGWKHWFSGLALVLATVSGCKQQCFLTHDDYKFYQDQVLSNVALANDPQVVAKPLHEMSRAPMTVNDTDREIRYMTLAEAIAIALEQGTVGNTNIDAAGLIDPLGSVGTSRDAPGQFGGAANTGRLLFGGSDAIRALRLDPALAGLNVEAALTRFDAVWTTSMNWQNTDRPIGTALDSFQAQGNNAIEQMDAQFQSQLLKPLPTGGVAGITFNTTYTLTNLPARVNPSYRPSLQFQFEQPLLQGYGVEINQLRTQHPGSILGLALPNLSPTSDGILITRLRFDQQRAEFERQVQTMVANVELQYWNLYYAYWNLYAAEALLKINYRTLILTEIRLGAGVQNTSAADVQRVRGEYENQRTNRLQAVNGVVNAERNLRAMLQLRLDDGYRIVPTDEPTLAAYVPNWEQGYLEAMALRPELYQARHEVKAQQLLLTELRNQLMPDLRFTASYDINSIGNRLDGSGDENAWRNLAENRHNNWSLGLRYTVPIGFRLAHANVRRGELALARAYETLKDSELKIERNLGLQYQRIFASYELIRIHRLSRIAYGEEVKTRLIRFEAGKDPINFTLDAQRNWANALTQEYRAIRDYNQSLVGWEFAKGTTMVRNNIQIAEGALPNFAQVRAAEHERERAAALKVREHPLTPGSITDAMDANLGALPPIGAPLPAIMRSMPLLRDPPPVGAISAAPMPTPNGNVVPGQPMLAGPAPGGPIPSGIKVEDLRQPVRSPETLPMPGSTSQPGTLPSFETLPPLGAPGQSRPTGLPTIPGPQLP